MRKRDANVDIDLLKYRITDPLTLIAVCAEHPDWVFYLEDSNGKFAHRHAACAAEVHISASIHAMYNVSVMPRHYVVMRDDELCKHCYGAI